MTAIGVDRDHARGLRAAEGVRARGGSAMEAALAAIEATFSPAIRHSNFKRRVAGLIRCGAAQGRGVQTTSSNGFNCVAAGDIFGSRYGGNVWTPAGTCDETSRI